jgi:hypothetical protein
MNTSSEMTLDRILCKLADDMDQLKLRTHLNVIYKLCEEDGLQTIEHLKMAVRQEVAEALKVLGEEPPTG